jgi:hypothetical protein
MSSFQSPTEQANMRPQKRQFAEEEFVPYKRVANDECRAGRDVIENGGPDPRRDSTKVYVCSLSHFIVAAELTSHRRPTAQPSVWAICWRAITCRRRALSR